MKRKANNTNGQEPFQKKPALRCILHTSGINHGDFTSLSNVKGSATEKLYQLHNIRDRRLMEPQDSPNRMEDVCIQIPENLEGANLEAIGYHRGCYQKFTKNKDRLKSGITANDKAATTARSPRKSSSSSTTRLFPPECIFCEKLEIKSYWKKEQCSKFPMFKDKDGTLKEPTWKQIEPRALELGDSRLHRKVQGEDLFAREAQFHPSCRNSFNLKYANYLRDTARATKFEQSESDQDRKASAHLKAFTAVFDFLQDCVIGQKKVVLLSSLRLLYIQELEKNGFANPEYRGEKLKARLENHEIHERIAFVNVNPGDKGCITYNLVYSATMSVAEAVAFAYKLGSKDKYEDVALLLRSSIQQAFKDSEPLPWPPSADDLEVKSSDELLPSDLLKFLNYVISGDADVERCEITRRIVLSIGQVCHVPRYPLNV